MTSGVEDLSGEALKSYADSHNWGQADWIVANDSVKKGNTYEKRTRLIVYDAPNAYGVSIEAGSECTYVVRKIDKAISRISLEVDGLTNVDWLLKRLSDVKP